MRIFFGVLTLLQCQSATAAWRYLDEPRFPAVPEYGPQPNVPYMVDNRGNHFRAAPDKGKQNGPVWRYSGSFEKYMASLKNKTKPGVKGPGDHAPLVGVNGSSASVVRRAASLHKRAPASSGTDFWIASLGGLGEAPLAGKNYTIFRNVVDDYGADPTGKTDTTEALNAAVQDGNRCGQACGNTFTQGAIVYFPPGTYKICSPIIQLYYTQFVGDPRDPPVIKGCDTFQGIALMDTDPYIPGGNGAEWYINQNQFFRHIRNFVFDMTEMPLSTADNDQPLVPTGIHWQVSQATTLQNLVFNMPRSTDRKAVTHVGVFMENGSGGFVSDLSFNGGAIGWRAGSQQYTARNLTFNGCLTAVQMVWDWGFNWQGITVKDSAIAFNISGKGGLTGQGIGSVSIIDSSLSNVPVGVLTTSDAASPNIVLDNLQINNVAHVVQVDNGASLLDGTQGSSTIEFWVTGRCYAGAVGGPVTGPFPTPAKAPRLLDGKSLFARSRPQYETVAVADFLIATWEGVKNDGTGDQTAMMNAFLQKARDSGKIAYFPAGIYQVGGTVVIPTGSRVQGSLWPQIQGAGAYFADMHNPKVVVQVGNRGDVGTMEIVEMLFSVKGPTAGAILMEWNVAASSQGSAAMWDSHFRVGGGTGTDLGIDNCPKGSFNSACIAASLLFHVTPQASGYFENVWAWVADHDNDMVMTDNPDPTANQISVYGARCMLIESQGPSWFIGTGSEHCAMYQYQLHGAKDIYLGHIQTETPYYQPNPVAPLPFGTAKPMPADPSFDACTTDSCRAAWGLRVIDSTNVTIHGSGLYSFFQDYYQDCDDTHDCQEKILEVRGSKSVAIFNLFTVATSIIAAGIDNTFVYQNNSNQRGYTTEISVWLPLDGEDDIGIVYVGTEIWSTPTATCSAPCVLVLPTSALPSPVTVTPSPYTTSLEYGWLTPSVVGNGRTVTTFVTNTTTVVFTPSPVVVTGMPFYNVNVTAGQTGGGFVASPSVTLSPILFLLPDSTGGTTTRTIILPPWPAVDNGPPVPGDPGFGCDDGFCPSTSAAPVPGAPFTFHTPFTTAVSASQATVTTLSFPTALSPITVFCPTYAEIVFQTPWATVTKECTTTGTQTIAFSCPATSVATFLDPSIAVMTVDCVIITTWDAPPSSTTTRTTTTTSTTSALPVWATWPPGALVPITDDIGDNDQQPDKDGTKTSCRVWFFFICIVWGEIKFLSFQWVFPPGIYPPLPPPKINLPPEWKLHGTLPPWPRITMGWDNRITYSEEPTSCTTKSASVCSTTTFYSATVTGGSTQTTATSFSSICQTIYGCDVTDSQVSTATTTAACTSPAAAARERHNDQINNDSAADYSLIQRADRDVCGRDAIVFPENPANTAEITNLLSAYAGQYEQIQAASAGYTAYFIIKTLDQQTMDKLKDSQAVDDAFYIEDWVGNTGLGNDPSGGTDSESRLPAMADAESETDTTLASPLFNRAPASLSTECWSLSVDSLPRNDKWQSPQSKSTNVGTAKRYNFYYDDAHGGADAAVYVIGESGAWLNHPQFQIQQGFQGGLNTLNPGGGGGYAPTTENLQHGTSVLAHISGATLGICKKCQAVWVDTSKWDEFNIASGAPAFMRSMDELRDIAAVLDDITTKGLQNKAVISASFSWKPKPATHGPAARTFHNFLKRLDDVGVVFVIAAGNHAEEKDEGLEISRFPQKFAQASTKYRTAALNNMILVGAATKQGYRAKFSQTAGYLTTYAPGDQLGYANTASSLLFDSIGRGTSFAAPQVAGLAAYLRTLDTKWKDQLRDPANVKKLITLLHRKYFRDTSRALGLGPNDVGKQVPIIWNGQVRDHSCLTDYDTKDQWDTDEHCPDIPEDLSKASPGEPADCGGASTASGSGSGASGSKPPKHKRDDALGGFCPYNPGGDGDGQTISYTVGPTPRPTCTANCGTLCTGFYCQPFPTGVPPDYMDPIDPSANQPVPTTSISGPGGSITTTNSASSVPTSGPGVYSIYLWVCNGSGSNSPDYRVGTAVKGGACGSVHNKLHNVPASFDSTYNICGGSRTLGEPIEDHGTGKTCRPILETGGSCCAEGLGFGARRLGVGTQCQDENHQVCSVSEDSSCNDTCADPSAS